MSKAQFYRPTGEEVHNQDTIQLNSSLDWSWYFYDVVEQGSIAGICLIAVKRTASEE